jgi:hypothetical protein
LATLGHGGDDDDGDVNFMFDPLQQETFCEMARQGGEVAGDAMVRLGDRPEGAEAPVLAFAKMTSIRPCWRFTMSQSRSGAISVVDGDPALGGDWPQCSQSAGMARVSLSGVPGTTSTV